MVTKTKKKKVTKKPAFLIISKDRWRDATIYTSLEEVAAAGPSLQEFDMYDISSLKPVKFKVTLV